MTNANWHANIFCYFLEYYWYWFFYQDGSIEFEARLTGILQVYVADKDEPNPYGTTIAPQISAQNHQHLFCIRLDPMIDGLKNSVVETDIVPSPHPTGSKENFADRKSTRLNSSHSGESRMPSSA